MIWQQSIENDLVVPQRVEYKLITMIQQFHSWVHMQRIKRRQLEKKKNREKHKLYYSQESRSRKNVHQLMMK